MAEFTEQSREQRQYEALRRIRHIVSKPIGMTRADILREIKLAAEDGLGTLRAKR